MQLKKVVHRTLKLLDCLCITQLFLISLAFFTPPVVCSVATSTDPSLTTVLQSRHVTLFFASMISQL